MGSRRRVALALTATLLAMALGRTGPAAADPAAEAAAAARALAVSVQGLKAATGSKDRISALTRTIRAYETGLDGLRNALKNAELREAALRQDLAAKEGQVSGLLGAMIAISSQPKPLVLLHPGGPLKSVEAGIVMQDVTPRLQAEAKSLKSELDEVARLRASRQAAEAALSRGMTEARAARTALSEAISNRVALPRRMIDDPAALKRLAANAATLSDFAAGLKNDPTAMPGFTSHHGMLPLPVVGRIVLRPGEADAKGAKRPGITIATLPHALVTAPFSGTVRYVGPLLDYGNVMILDPGDGYLIVLAGMDRIYTKVGQVVGANAPLGLMGGGNAVDAGLRQMQQTGAEPTQRLYLELRKGARAIDPRGWFAASQG